MLPPFFIERSRLHRQLDRAAEADVVGVSAPPGWGKSLLVAAWARDRPCPPVWVRPQAALPTGSVDALVLEDLHLLAEDEVRDRLGAARERAGTVLALSRRPLAATLRSVFGAVGTVLGPDELALDESEFEQLVSLTGRRRPPSWTTRVHGLARGWPAALAAAAVEPEGSGAPAWPGPVTTAVVTEDVLDALTPAQQELVLALGLGDRTPAGLLERIAGPVDPDDLAVLVDHGLVTRDADLLHTAPGLGPCLRELQRRRSPQELRDHHARAARWYDETGEPACALQHAIEAGDLPRITAVLQRCWLGLVFLEPDLVRRALAPLPARGRTDPELRLAAVAAWSRVDPEAAAVLLRGIHAAVGGSQPPGESAQDRLRRELITHVVTSLVAGRGSSLALPGTDAAVGLRARVDALQDELDPPLADAVVAFLLVQGTAALLHGDMRAAKDLLRRGVGRAFYAGLHWPESLGRAHLALALVLAGEPTRAAAEIDQVDESDLRGPGAASVELARGLVLLEAGRAEEAREPLASARQRGVEPALAPLLLHAEALRDLLLGDQAVGLERLEDFEERRAATPYLVELVTGTRALLELRADAGAERAARSWSTGWGRLAAVANLVYAGPVPASLPGLGSVEELADGEAGRVRADLLLAEATSALAAGDQGRAVGLVERALGRAARTGAWRPFHLVPRGTVVRLLGLVDTGSTSPASREQATVVRERLGVLPVGDGEVPVLTPRELLVLARLGGGRPAHVIAQELFVSPNTLKSQLRSIYRKLQVSSREEAVARGRRLGLVP